MTAARRWPAELAGWAAALAVSIGVVGVVASVSADLLFTDGDSLIVAMVVRSFALGQPQDWAMSPVLFLPEIAVFGLLSLLGLGLRATIVLNGVVNLLALYGALRVVAGRRAAGRAPVAAALAAFGAVAILGLLEGTATRDGAAFATLFTTTTYYSATVVAMLVTVGLIRRLLERPDAASWPTLAVVAAIAAVSILSNPLFALWAVAPAGVVLATLAVARRAPWRTVIVVGAALAIGAALGYAARGFFAGTIVAQSDNYFRLGQVGRSADAYGAVLTQTASTWHGALWLVLVLALWAGAVGLAVAAWRARQAGVAFAAGVAALGPVLVTLGAFALGTDAVRYLQPWLFLPAGALACVRPAALSSARRRVAVAATTVVAVAAALIGAPAAAAAASGTDRDVQCVVDWVTASGRTGAGQFWTVRAPKAALPDPTRLVQVDHTLRVYTWLTNRTDADGARVTFLVQDAQSPAFQLPDGASIADVAPVACGRYTIYDFGDRVLPLGPPRD